ncbi:hypothetical protein ACIRBX_03760 [Kitasatospora sp. NPDC096147]|uniref:hypothetical protein n=1 Tax=Kitasatospora sp. NPDC096147 TaxID=3364093 RepID=UPI0038161341
MPDFEDMEGLIAELVVPQDAPMAVMSALGTSRELLRFSFYRFEFATVAITHALVALELALAAPPSEQTAGETAGRPALAELVRDAVKSGRLPAPLAGPLASALALPGELVRGERTSAACHPATAVGRVRAVFDAVAALVRPAARPGAPDGGPAGDPLVRLYDEFRAMRFPLGFQGAGDLAGLDLVVVDLLVTGLVSGTLDGPLDAERQGELWEAVDGLDRVIPLIHDPYCKLYFTRLRRLGTAAAERHGIKALGTPGGRTGHSAERAASGPGASLAAAFPSELAADVRAVLALLPAAEHRPVESFAVRVGDEVLAIPERLHHAELPTATVELLTPRQRKVLHCLYTRHHDGRVRQRHLAPLLTATDPWVVPYTVRLLGEYVLEILTDLRDGYRELLVPGARGHAVYGQFVLDNPEFFARTERRLVSYWSEYHRHAYQSFQGYPGGTALDHLRAAASDRAGRQWPDATPGRRTRLHGYC